VPGCREMDDMFKISHHFPEVMVGFVGLREGPVCTVLWA
jgi:hypothetical protein